MNHGDGGNAPARGSHTFANPDRVQALMDQIEHQRAMIQLYQSEINTIESQIGALEVKDFTDTEPGQNRALLERYRARLPKARSDIQEAQRRIDRFEAELSWITDAQTML